MTDWKIRRAPNRLWYIMGAVGLALGLYQLYGYGFDSRFIFSWAIGFAFVFVLMYFLYYLFQYVGMAGLGGADAKALIAIAILFPYYPVMELAGISLPIVFPYRTFAFGFAVFGNALALNLVVPVAVLIYNLATVPFGEIRENALGAFTGYRMSVESLKGKHVRLMHRYCVENDRLIMKRALGGSEVDDEAYENLLKWKKEGKIGDKVWITPKIPFLIPITLGFIVAVAYGDILTQIISLFVMR